jgi:hypothetical protein
MLKNINSVVFTGSGLVIAFIVIRTSFNSIYVRLAVLFQKTLENFLEFQFLNLPKREHDKKKTE